MTARSPQPSESASDPIGEAEALSRAGRPGDAVAAIERGIAGGADEALATRAAQGLARIARDAEGAEAFDVALAALERACRLRSRWADQHFHRGRMLATLKRPAEARRAFDRAIELNPGYAAARVERALLDAAAGRVGEALDALRALGRDTSAADTPAFEGGIACLERADWEEAARLLASAFTEPATGLAARLDALRERIEAGDVEVAARLLRECVGRHAAYPDVHHLLGMAELRLGRPDDALMSLARALELNPEFHDARIEFAQALDAAGQRAQATEQLQIVLQHAPGHAHAQQLHALWTRRGARAAKAS